MTTKVIQIGMGPLGIKIAEFIAQRNGIEIVFAVDKNPDLIGKRLQELSSSLSDKVTISGTLSEAMNGDKPDVAILTTVSDMERVTPQVLAVLEYGIPVVSTCEELSYPWICSSELSMKIDAAAKKKKVAVLGTGINPGFLMDSLPTFLTSICQSVEHVTVRRFQDASARRVPFQKKIGAGLWPDEFEKRKADQSLRHVGLTESIQHIASSLGWTLDQVTDEINPVMAEESIHGGAFEIQPGMAAGVNQIGLGKSKGEEKIRLEFQAAVGEPESFDEIDIKGSPHIKSRIEGGVNGDVATCAITVNSARAVLSANPGLRIMSDMPLVSFFSQ